MRFYWKRWQLALVAVLAACALSIGVAGEAFAALNGESDTFTPETLDNGLIGVQSQDSISEATNGGNFIEVWRGATNNAVWLSVNHGLPFQIGGATATFAHPTVIPWGTDGFAIFHTGTNGHIYWNFWNPTVGSDDQWIQVPGQTTPNNMPVAAVQAAPGSLVMFLTYRSATNTQIWGTVFNGQGAWVNTALVGGGGGEIQIQLPP
jgi:hypothetical protein